jgi:succinyldiaminopimelate transaminase
LLEARRRAEAHPGGLIDLSIGTPVDPTPELATAALAAAANSPGYPMTAGTSELRAAIAGYLHRRWQVDVPPAATLPVIGTKELVAWLPTLLGLDADDVVVHPAAAYPTYAVGAAVAGSRAVAAADPDELRDLRPGVVWLNSPSNPTGEILSRQRMRAWVEWARDRGAVVASDECYGEFGWEAEPISVLHPDVCAGSHSGLLAVHSLSKRSNLAGYRAGFVAGDPDLVANLLAVRKHLGMIVPRPVQDVMVVLLDDSAHMSEQRGRYLSRRTVLRPGLEAAGFRIEHSEGGIYLWATRGEPGRVSLDFLADRGILVAPGDFYGDAAKAYVRVALTAPDAAIADAAERLLSGP